MIFPFAEYGFNLPEDGLYVAAAQFAQAPQRYCAFARASLAGWQYAFAHQEEALDLVMREVAAAKLPVNLAHQRWMLKEMEKLVLPAGRASLTAGPSARPG